MKPLLMALCLWGHGACAQAALQLDSPLTLHMEDPRFGGFSSLAITPDGTAFISTSDRGSLLRGRLDRRAGHLAGVSGLRITDLLDSKGHKLSGYNTDAEGLAISKSGAVYISYESNHRIMRQDSLTALPVFLPKHPDFKTLQSNSGLEALAIGPDDTIYAIPERSGGASMPFPVYRYKDGQWDKDWKIPRQGRFLAVGADVFEGYLYLLERDLVGFSGFASRIRRFRIGAKSGAVLFESPPGQFDNLEGLAVWKTPEGQIKLLTISDDNFFILQSTQLVEFSLETAP